MCWSETATLAFAGLGTAATLVAYRRGEPLAIWGTIGYFTSMELLQLGGYAVINQCEAPANRLITQLSYLHIALQPIIVNLFVMALSPTPIPAATRRLVLMLASLGTAVLLLRLVPMGWAGTCSAGDVFCGPDYCTVSGNWHLAWEVPLNRPWDLIPLVGDYIQIPGYMMTTLLLPLLYGAWRFSLFNLCFGPILAAILTDNPNEWPAVWCLFSVGIVLITLSPVIRRTIAPDRAHPA